MRGVTSSLTKIDDEMIRQRTPRGWTGILPEGYTPGIQTRVVRHTLIGGRLASEDAAVAKPTLEMRYFEIPPGAVTRLEKHEHEHYVLIGEGTGFAIVGPTVTEVKTHDVVYVGPLVPHQFVNRGTATFGIFCVVTAERDYSQALSDDEIAELRSSPAGPYLDPDGAPPPRRANEIIQQ